MCNSSRVVNKSLLLHLFFPGMWRMGRSLARAAFLWTINITWCHFTVAQQCRGGKASRDEKCQDKRCGAQMVQQRCFVTRLELSNCAWPFQCADPRAFCSAVMFLVSPAEEYEYCVLTLSSVSTSSSPSYLTYVFFPSENIQVSVGSILRWIN